jgi:flagellar FliL protein
MASKDTGRDRNLDDDEEAPKKAPKQRSELVRIVIPGAIALFLAILGAQVAAPIVTSMIAGNGAANEEAADEEALADDEGLEPEDLQLAALAPAIYAPLDPPLVVSFGDAGNTRFLQLTLQAMARSEKAIAGIKQHAPAIRNAFLFLLSAHEIDELLTLEGKEKLRAEMTASAQDILVTNTGEPGLEELYFTSFVIQ